MGSVTANVACSLASINIITILTKEGSVQKGHFSMTKIGQTSIIFFAGIIISVTISFLLWSSSATKQLRQSMIKSTDSFAEMLNSITQAFLTGSEDPLLKPSFQKSFATYRNMYTTLSKNLQETKYEHYIRGTEKVYHLETELSECMQRLAQNIGGLQSAAWTQFSLLRQVESAESQSRALRIASSGRPINNHQRNDSQISGVSQFGSVTPVGSYAPLSYREPLRVNMHNMHVNGSTPQPQQEDDSEDLTTRNLFESFIEHLGPSMVC